MTPRYLTLLCACMLLPAAVLAQQPVADPTRPPPESRMLPSTGAEAAPVPAGPVLQSVLIGSHGREVAVISGQTVRKGERFDGYVLVKVSKNQVVLQQGRNKKVLTLFPEDGKKAVH